MDSRKPIQADPPEEPVELASPRRWLDLAGGLAAPGGNESNVLAARSSTALDLPSAIARAPVC